VVFTTYMNFVLNFVAVVLFMLISGVDVRWSWLELVPLVLLLGAFCTGIAMALSALFVRYRDVQPIWDVVSQVVFYATPIIYPLEKIPSRHLQELVMCNPLAAIVVQTRHALIDPSAPSAAAAIGGAARLLIPLGILVLVCVLGYRIFNRSAPHIAEDL
jgi:ABC-2 type transport system permease protein